MGDINRNNNTRKNDNLNSNKRTKSTQPIDKRDLMQEKKPRKKSKKKKRKALRRTCLGLFIFMVIVFSSVIGIGIGIVARIVDSSPELEMISIAPTEYTTIFKDMNGNEVERYHMIENREYVKLNEIPINLQNAIVAIEDERFYKHNGIDFKGIVRAFFTTAKNKITGSKGLQGASTITQQLIKNNVTKVQRNTIKTKIQEQYLALEYEKELEKQLGSKKASKDYILELYLNTIALGHGYYGVEAASLGYFNKPASELTLAESASIAGITNNPSLYSPRSNPEGNKKRQTRILNKMLEQKMITQEEYNQAIKEDIYSKVSQTTGGRKEVEGTIIHSYFADSAFEQISKDLQDKYKISPQQANNLLYTGGLVVNLSLDTNAQKIVDNVMMDDKFFPDVPFKIDVTYNVSVINEKTEKQEHYEFKQFVKSKESGEEFVAKKREELKSKLSSDEKILLEKTNFSSQPQASMVIIDYKNGLVRAISAGRDEKLVNRGFNRATDAVRQPGSVFKVISTFAPGIDMGILTPATVIDDVPFSKGNYSPKNWYSGYRGLSTVREAIRDSMNIVTVKALDMIGVDAAYQYLLNFGFTTLENDNHLATALGGLTKGVTELELTQSFATIANGGKYLEPKFYTTVLDRQGKVLLDVNERKPVQVLKETTAFLLTDMMEDVVTSGTGKKAKFKKVKMPVSGKTGTTQETKDLAFVGFTPYYAAGIWTGYDRYDKTVPNMQKLSNKSYHFNIWREIMETLHKDLKNIPFPMPEGIVKARICQESGLLATELCALDPRGDRTRVEYFAKGTEPKKECDVHVSIKICKDSNKLATEFCPPESIETRSGIVRPIPYEGSTPVEDQQYEIKFLNEPCDIHSAENTTTEEIENNSETTSIDSNSKNDSFENNNFEKDPFESNSNVTEKNSETTTLPEIFGKPVESVPETETTTKQTNNTETTTKQSTSSSTEQPKFE